MTFLKREVSAAKGFLEKIGAADNAIMFQWFGGFMAPPEACGCKETDYEVRFNAGRARGYRASLQKETAQAIADGLKKEGYKILTVEGPNYPTLKGHTSIASPLRAVMTLLPIVKTFVSIASFVQHASAIYDKRGLVLWGGTSPKLLGYEHNDNFFMDPCCPTPFCHRPNSFFFDNRDGYNWACVRDDECMDFDPDEVISRTIKLIEEGE
jgi:hypothetical protein